MRLRFPDRFKALDQTLQHFKAGLDVIDRQQLQLVRFNQVWHRALSIPFYEKWAAENSLPGSISRIEDLAKFPILTKSTIVDNADLVFRGFDPNNCYTTGGSTGEPAKYPKGPEDAAGLWANTFVARDRSDLRPGDVYVHLWGHSHLFGAGRSAAIRKRLRRIKDYGVGGIRLNAYDQSPSSLRRYLEEIRRVNPKYVIGYASAIRAIADTLLDQDVDYRLSNLSTVIVTSETSTHEDLRIIEKAFCCPVSQEYGTAETGVVASTLSPGLRDLEVHWASFAVNAGHDGAIAITTLDQRGFPLINYSPGDRIETSDDNSSVFRVSKIIGRSKDIVNVSNMNGEVIRVNMIAVAHVLKTVPAIRTVQAVASNDCVLRVLVTAPLGSPKNEEQLASYLAAGLSVGQNSPVDKSSLSVEIVDRPYRSVSGKVTMMIPAQAAVRQADWL